MNQASRPHPESPHDILSKRPFTFRCGACDTTTSASTIDPPASAGCESGGHVWRRRVELDRVRVHEAGHALVALAAGGTRSVQAVRVEGQGKSDTTMNLEPFSTQALLATLGGRSASALVGDPRDGWYADSGRFRWALLGWLTRRLSPTVLSSIEPGFGSRLDRCVEQVVADLAGVADIIVRENTAALAAIALALRDGSLEAESLEQIVATSGLIARSEQLRLVLDDGYAEEVWRRA